MVIRDINQFMMSKYRLKNKFKYFKRNQILEQIPSSWLISSYELDFSKCIKCRNMQKVREVEKVFDEFEDAEISVY